MLKKMQGRLKESSRSIGLITVKLFTGFMVGLTLALVFKQLMGLETFMFTFVIVCCIGIFVRLSAKWKFSGVILFNLFCVMTAMLVRMYIMIAPGQ